MKSNAALVFDPGNQFGSLVEAKPYFGIPSWWRPFIFRVLSQRDLSVYVYLCSMMDVHDVCYPTTEQIRDEIGVDSPTTLFTALGNLESLGFVMRRRKKLPGRAYRFQRNIYQRPAPEFTLLKLLEMEKVDGDLRPILPISKLPHGEPDTAVATGLRRLLGGTAYAEYDRVADDNKTYKLRVLLQTRLEERRAEFGPIAQRLADEAAIGGVTINGKRYRTREVNVLGDTVIVRSRDPINELPESVTSHSADIPEVLMNFDF